MFLLKSSLASVLIALLAIGWLADWSRADVPANTASPVLVPLPVPADRAMAHRPECDQAVAVRVRGAWYAVGSVQHAWRIAVTEYAVRQAGAEVRLRVAFDRRGEVADWSLEPPQGLEPGLYEACLGLGAEAVCPAGPDPRTPVSWLAQAARHFAMVWKNGDLERSVSFERQKADWRLTVRP